MPAGLAKRGSGMREIEYLCETIGLDPASFYLSVYEGKKVVASDFTMMESDPKIDYDSDKQTLKSAISMYKDGMKTLQTELEMMERFYRTYNEPDTDRERVNANKP
jgi:hypothetical protein